MPINTPHKILFIRPSALGDVCRSVPVVASLRQAFPDARIDWLVQSEFIDAVNGHPALSNVIPFPRTLLRKWFTPSGLNQIVKLCKSLQQEQYDLVIDGQGLGRSGFLSWITRAPRRIGPKNAREFGWLGYTDRVNTTKEHTVDSMLELVEHLNISPTYDMQLVVPKPEQTWWSTYRLDHEIKKYVVLAPTSRWKSKQWPVERFIEISTELQHQGYRVVVVGAPQEQKQIEPLLQIDNVINLLPTMTIGRLLAVIEHGNLLLGNDSAALHIAVGLKVPIVGLFGPTNPVIVGPYQQIDAVIAAPVQYSNVHYRDSGIGDRIMQEIAVSTVMQKVDEVLSSSQS